MLRKSGTCNNLLKKYNQNLPEMKQVFHDTFAHTSWDKQETLKILPFFLGILVENIPKINNIHVLSLSECVYKTQNK